MCRRTKTISLARDAYDILRNAKRSPRESFSDVVRRASWDDPAETMGETLEFLEAEFGQNKVAITSEELETSRRLHAQRKQAVKSRSHS